MSPVTAQRALQMVENESLWAAATRVNGLLVGGGIPYAIVGGVAVCLHGYRRNTVDLNLLIRPADAASLRTLLEGDGIAWDATAKEFRCPSGVPVQLLMAGETEGPGQPTVFPDPADTQYLTAIEGLPVLSLPQLIQAKLACGLGNLRRTHKDFADVVELIAIHELDGSFARLLHKSVRKEFKELLQRVRG